MLAEITRNLFTRVNMWYDMRGTELNMEEAGQMYAFSVGLFFCCILRYQYVMYAEYSLEMGNK